jgi:TonB family protein
MEELESTEPFFDSDRLQLIDVGVSPPGNGTIQYAPYPGGNLRFSKMIDERSATYQVLVGRQDVYPDGEIMVALPDSTPPDTNRLWRVAVVGPTKVVNGLGNTIVVCEVKFLGYYDPPPPSSGAANASGSHQAYGHISAPVLIFSVEPELTEAARQAKFAANVPVSMVVDVTGKPTEIHVDKRVGYGLEQKAIEAVAQYKFRPAMKDGVAVPASLNVEVNFQIF